MNEINEYFDAKAKQIKLEKLLAWQEFYLLCKNDFKARHVGFEIEKL